MFKHLISATVFVASLAHAEDSPFYVKVTGEIDGKAVAFSCSKPTMTATREFGDNFYPSPGNKFRSYQISCAKEGGKFAGASIKFNSSLDPLKEKMPPYDGSTAWEALDKTFTVRLADGSGKEIQIHSFMNSKERSIAQHYTGTPEATITEFVVAEEGGKTFHTIAGTIKAEFEEKVIKGKQKGSKGKVELTFRDKFRFVSDIGVKK
jgi:hypothetical protein